MRYTSTLIAVSDMEKSVNFYNDVLGLEIVEDFGANKILTGGISLQTIETWKDFIDNANVQFGSNSGELYFVEDNLDVFLKRIELLNIECVHPLKEHSWGQRVIRLYDPDKHIIEVGESLKTVCKRFRMQGMNNEQIARRMDVQLEFVEELLR